MADRADGHWPERLRTESSVRSGVKAPSFESLPRAKARTARGSLEVREINVRMEVVTPIFGGGVQTRSVDEVDVIRAPSVRGHLRCWWRALYAAQCASAEELYERESALWGRAATDAGGRSAVEIRIDVEHVGQTDNSDIRLYPSRQGQATPGAYALWPARAETRGSTPAPRRQPGTQFQLTLRAAGTSEAEIRNALRAWILFGGYGGRTRRGLGSVKVLGDQGSWLPVAATRDALENLFGLDVLVSPTKAPGDSPWLGGAALQVGTADRDAMRAWTTALDWLKEFRQGTSGPQGDRAREPGTGKPQPQRPSISNWPEADKVRRIKNKTNAHAPRHNETPAWPRAGFGLPMIGQFQRTDRNDNRDAYDEPDPFELRWRTGNFEHDRLASQLIVKALPLADGTFVPCALWLNRAYPAGGEVILKNTNNSQAPFDRLVANGDTARFSALANKANLRQAFLDWLHAKYQTTVVAP
ncbi:type III-B CRISPR module RAMP protein Cmr1 [Myxococcota bacterium]|nr:type III-B CRISPR module RAMP protein Cmr1 [Myxococcota bacterium]MCZ7620394.1 type III-B CRISPR module RAMP protein Cmr1 [Myxococcota bacterium]